MRLARSVALMSNRPLFSVSWARSATVDIRWRRLTCAARVLPDFIVIGAQKAGTTSLYGFLADHRSVIPAVKKEVHYFDLNHSRGRCWYRHHFPLAVAIRRLSDRFGEQALTGEASAYYLFHPLAAGRVAREVPASKLIVLLRNPVDRAYSHYQHEVRRGREEMTFADAVRVEQDRLRGEEERLLSDSAYRSEPHRQFSYLARGRYAEQLRRWFQLFPPERFHIVCSEDFQRDPAAAVREVLEFLGIHSGMPPGYRFLPANEGRYQPMDRGFRRDLEAYFEPHNDDLYRLLGRDFHW